MLQYKFATPTYNVVAGDDDNALVSERSTVGHYLQMYDWDSCFFSQGQKHFGDQGLAKQFVSNFLSLKEADGYIPRTISPKRIWDGKDLCKPFLAQALLAELKLKENKISYYSELIADLDCYYRYFERSHRHESGLFHWRNALESGVDNNLALLAPQEAAKDENDSTVVYPDGFLLASDLNSYLVAEYQAFSEIARQAGRIDLADEYLRKAKKLISLIEKMLWNEKEDIYSNFDPRSNQQMLTKSWTALVPVLFSCASP